MNGRKRLAAFLIAFTLILAVGVAVVGPAVAVSHCHGTYYVHGHYSHSRTGHVYWVKAHYAKCPKR